MKIVPLSEPKLSRQCSISPCLNHGTHIAKSVSRCHSLIRGLSMNNLRCTFSLRVHRKQESATETALAMQYHVNALRSVNERLAVHATSDGVFIAIMILAKYYVSIVPSYHIAWLTRVQENGGRLGWLEDAHAGVEGGRSYSRWRRACVHR